MYSTDTIAAQATATGRAGVGIIRVSGPAVSAVASAILGKVPKPRTAEYLPFLDEQNKLWIKASPCISLVPIPLPVKMYWNYKATVAQCFWICCCAGCWILKMCG